MTEQLDVFLGIETAPFLGRLFDAIESQEYLSAATDFVDHSSTETSIVNQIVEIVSKSDRECTPPLVDVSGLNNIQKNILY